MSLQTNLTHPDWHIYEDALNPGGNSLAPSPRPGVDAATLRSLLRALQEYGGQALGAEPLNHHPALGRRSNWLAQVFPTR